MEAGLLQHTFCLPVTGELYPSVGPFGRVSRSMRRTSINLAALPKRKAEFIEPMECAPVTKLVDGPGWVYEIKLDGYRAIAVKTDGGVSLFSRRHKSLRPLPSFQRARLLMEKLSRSMNQAVRTSTCSRTFAVELPISTISSLTSSFATTTISPDCP